MLGPKPVDKANAGKRKQKSGRGAACGEDRALGEKLAHQTAAAGAERAAHRELLLPRIGARDHQVADVQAADEEHERDRCAEHEERWADMSGHDVLKRSRPEPKRAGRVVLGIRCHEASRQHVEPRLHVGERYSGSEPRDRRGNTPSALVAEWPRKPAAIASKIGATGNLSVESHRLGFKAWELRAWSATLEREFHEQTELTSDGELRFRRPPPEWQHAFVEDMQAGRYFETTIRHPALLFFAQDLDLERSRQFSADQQRELRPMAEAIVQARRA